MYERVPFPWTMTLDDWEHEFLLLMEPLIAHASESRARIRLPGGRPRSSGPESDSFEALARSLWMGGPWLSTHPKGEARIGGRDVDRRLLSGRLPVLIAACVPSEQARVRRPMERSCVPRLTLDDGTQAAFTDKMMPLSTAIR
jgi:hypothetical protein